MIQTERLLLVLASQNELKAYNQETNHIYLRRSFVDKGYLHRLQTGMHECLTEPLEDHLHITKMLLVLLI